MADGPRSSDWTIETLKELLEGSLKGLAHRCRDDKRQGERIQKQRDIALKLQADEYIRRLDALNGEQARIAQTQVTYVSRETWENFHKGDDEWKRRAESLLAKAMPRDEFETYKGVTQRALSLEAGKQLADTDRKASSQISVSQILGIIAATAAVASTAAAVVSLLISRPSGPVAGAPQTAPQVIYMPPATFAAPPAPYVMPATPKP